VKEMPLSNYTYITHSTRHYGTQQYNGFHMALQWRARIQKLHSHKFRLLAMLPSPILTNLHILTTPQSVYTLCVYIHLVLLLVSQSGWTDRKESRKSFKTIFCIIITEWFGLVCFAFLFLCMLTIGSYK